MGHGLELLSDPVAERLLASTYPARLAYNWTDGTPRVIPICFHWDGSALHFGTQPHAPKIRALSANPQVAVTIDSVTFPYDVLLLRGSVAIEVQDDVVPEYALAVERYMGPEIAPGWLAPFRGQPMAKITFTPEWARVLDFRTRFPSAMSA
jgi:hypothetical protein